MKMNGDEYPLETLLMARIVDDLSMILYSKTKDAEKGVNRPESVLSRMLKRDDKPKEQDYMTFDTIEEYEEFMKQKRGENEWQQ